MAGGGVLKTSLKLYLKIVPQIAQKNPWKIGFSEGFFARFEVQFDEQQIVPKIVPVFCVTKWVLVPSLMTIDINSLGVIRFGWEQKYLRSYFFGRYIGDLIIGIVHQNLLYDTMHKSLAFHWLQKKSKCKLQK